MSYSYNYSTHFYSEDDRESLLKRSSALGIAEGSYAEKISDNNGELWIRTFLINHERNKRGWSIDKNTSLRNVYTIVGQPIVLKQDQFGNADHPEFKVHADASANAKEQNKYKIGTVERVYYDKESDSYYCDSKITDPAAKAFIRKFNEKRIPCCT